MNIFFLDIDPETCAKMHVDKHVVKMILESVQILCSVHHIMESHYKPPYKLSHKNHPCCIWARESLSNYIWLISLTQELCKEYTYRYGKTHKSQQYLEELSSNLPSIPELGFTEPRKAMPEYCKEKDPMWSYRNYYYYEKKNLHSWKKRDVPEWINDYLD